MGTGRAGVAWLTQPPTRRLEASRASEKKAASETRLAEFTVKHNSTSA